jgi:hypothetical protein
LITHAGIAKAIAARLSTMTNIIVGMRPPHWGGLFFLALQVSPGSLAIFAAMRRSSPISMI